MTISMITKDILKNKLMLLVNDVKIKRYKLTHLQSKFSSARRERDALLDDIEVTKNKIDSIRNDLNA